MTGPAHYLAAEGILKDALKAAADGATDVSEHIAVAQVHATLALAAAAALADYHDNGMTEGDQIAWYRAASEQPEHARRKNEARKAEDAELAAMGTGAES